MAPEIKLKKKIFKFFHVSWVTFFCLGYKCETS